MHETAIVLQLIASVEDELARRGIDGRARTLDLAIGRLSCANADSIRAAFGLIAEGTRVEGAVLRIREILPVATCQSCGFREPVEDCFAVCGRCGGCDLVLDGGQDLLLESMEIETDEE